MKLNCLVIDDEPIARQGIEGFAEKLDYLHLVGSLSHTLKASQFLRANPVDLIYLDIQMPDLSGLEFLRSLPHPPMVIFTTAHRKYAVEGFELNAIDYLMKPISFERFLKASNKALEAFQASKPATSEDFFFIKSDKQYIKIAYEDICFVESAKDYVYIHTPEARHLALLSLKQLEERLPGQQFIRVHRSYLVGIAHIDVLQGNRIFVQGQEIPISRSLQEEVFKRLVDDKLWKRGG